MLFIFVYFSHINEFKLYVCNGTCVVFLRIFELFNFSTSKGVIVDRVARANKIGGEILFYIW